MCMNPNEVRRLILQTQCAYKNKAEQLFDETINKLEQELRKVTLSNIDRDALVHSFM